MRVCGQTPSQIGNLPKFNTEVVLMNTMKKNSIGAVTLFSFNKFFDPGQQENNNSMESIIQKSDQIHSEIEEQKALMKKIFNI
jgi:hypothetical protein